MIKFALVGCGNAGRQHAGALHGIASLTAVCDSDGSKAASLATACEASAFESFDEMLAQSGNADVIGVCTPNGNHAEHVIKSLQAGKHVVCESPLCLTSSAAWQIAETGKFCGKKVFVVDRLTNTNAAREAVAVVKAVPFQTEPLWHFSLTCSAHKIDDAPWITEAFPGGGPLYTPFAEYVGVLRSLFGRIEKAEAAEEPQWLTKRAGFVTVRFEAGAVCQLSWKIADEEPEDASLSVTNAPFGNGASANKPQIIAVFGEDQKNNLTDLYRSFLLALDNGAEDSTLLSAVQTVETIEAICKAFRAD